MSSEVSSSSHPPGEAKPDWWIFTQVARAMGFKRNFDFYTPEEVWDEYRLLTAGTPCDQMGMTNERLAKTSLRWPCPYPRHPGTPRRYTRRKFFTESEKAQFHTPVHQPPDENTDEEFPLGLTTGRIESQWHTRTRTGKVPQLVRKDPEPFVEIHPDDAIENDVQDGEWVYLVGRRGRCYAKARCHRDNSAGFTLYAVPLGRPLPRRNQRELCDEPSI